MKDLIKQLFELDELHQEYQDNECSYEVNSKKDGNTLTIQITLKENKDKKEFEKWINSMPDDFFTEVWETLAETKNLSNLDDVYNSENYKIVIDEFKKAAKEIALKKIDNLKRILA